MLTEAQNNGLTQSGGQSQPCANPICDGLVIKKPHGKHGRYCSGHCRLDGYVIRRATEMLKQLGPDRFGEIIAGKVTAEADEAVHRKS